MDRRGSRSGRARAGSNLWDRGSRAPDQCVRSDLLSRALQGNTAETMQNQRFKWWESPGKKKKDDICSFRCLTSVSVALC